MSTVDAETVLRSLLDFVTVDALVTQRHADEMAAELASALHQQGYRIVRLADEPPHPSCQACGMARQVGRPGCSTHFPADALTMTITIINDDDA